jgi:hypothetical protein
VLEARVGTGDIGRGCTRRAWDLGTRMGHARLARGAALGLPQELRLSRRQQYWKGPSLQQRPWGKPLNLAPFSQGRLGEEQARWLKDHLVLLGEQAKETGERNELQAEGLLSEEETVPHSALRTRKRLDTRKPLSICPHQINMSFQKAAWLRRMKALKSQNLSQNRSSYYLKKKSLDP